MKRNNKISGGLIHPRWSMAEKLPNRFLVGDKAS